MNRLPEGLIKPNTEDQYHVMAAKRDWRIAQELFALALFFSAAVCIGAGLVGGA